MAVTSGMTVGQLVVERPARARVFERLGIDYCCGGKLQLEAACAKRGLDVSAVVSELAKAEEGGASERDWSKAGASELADHIEARHHGYLRRELPRLAGLTTKVANAHGAKRPALVMLRDEFDGFMREMNAHMEKEERVLFPWIRGLERGDGGIPASGVGAPVQAMMHEHDSAGDSLGRMRELTDGFVPPSDACNTYRAMLDSLAELEADMHAHVHKENNILFPAALRLEAMKDGGSCCACRAPGGS